MNIQLNAKCRLETNTNKHALAKYEVKEVLTIHSNTINVYVDF